MALAYVINRLVSVIATWVRDAAKAAVSTMLFTQQTGQTRANLARWDLAARQAGLSEGEAASTMQMAAQTRVRAAVTGEGQTPYLHLFHGMPKDDDTLFRLFSASAKRMEEAEAVWWGAQLGFSANWSAFLRNFTGEFKELSTPLLTDKAQQDLIEMNAAIVGMSASWARLKALLVAEVAPTLTWFFEKMSNLLGYQSLAGRKTPFSSGYGPSGSPTAFIGGYRPSTVTVSSPKVEVSVSSPKVEVSVTTHGIDDAEGVGRAVEHGLQKALDKVLQNTYRQIPTP